MTLGQEESLDISTLNLRVKESSFKDSATADNQHFKVGLIHNSTTKNYLHGIPNKIEDFK